MNFSKLGSDPIPVCHSKLSRSRMARLFPPGMKTTDTSGPRKYFSSRVERFWFRSASDSLRIVQNGPYSPFLSMTLWVCLFNVEKPRK